jgi:predicted ATP-grasp superfamily ATP-dependent carboligase
MKPAVLVTDAWQRKAVPIIRSLGRRGIPVLAADNRPWSMGFFSRYCVKSLICPSPEQEPERFLQWVLTLARRGDFQVLFAIDERSLDVLTPHRDSLAQHVKVPMVNGDTYLQARDKALTLNLAQRLGIPCPRTGLAEDEGDLRAMAASWDFPMVIKPRRSSGSRGLKVAYGPEELVSLYRLVAQDYPRPLLQEFIPPGGETLGVEVLMNRNSEPRATFVHRRLREYPPQGGPSTLRESIAAPELVAEAVRLLKAMDWYGVAMVEFKRDPRDGILKLMEVNPKFWGSIALPIAAGLDFPYLLYRLAVEGDVPPTNSYKTGVICRWLIPGDILHFLHNPRRFHLTPSFFQFRGDNLYYDLEDLDDPGPFWGMLLSALSSLTAPGFWKRYLSANR